MSTQKLRVSFAVLDAGSRRVKVLGVLNYDEHKYNEIPDGNGIKKGDEGTFSGKYLLHDYKDLSENHTYTFQFKDITFTGILQSFTYDCTYACKMNLGTPQFEVMI